jgi:protein gp37
MAAKTTIEWTEATWNPVTGCTKLSPGCDNCYAERFAERWRGIPGHPFEQGFDLRLHHERLHQPAKWKRPRFIFVNSMSDLFHKGVPVDFVHRVFDAMEEAPHHVYQLLTKRSSLMRSFVNARYGDTGAPPYIWLGVSVEDEHRLSRIRHLRETRAAMRFLSLEPLLGPIRDIPLDGISWVIVGGESGPAHRPIHEEWVAQIRDQCLAFQVAFFFKQWGGARPKTGGRMLQEREWNNRPALKGHPLFASVKAA